MNFFTKQWRTLLLSAVLVVGVCLVGCADKPTVLVGQWVHVSGVTSNKPEKIEMFSNGTGVIDGEVSITWKVENKRLMLLSSLKGLACDYKVADYELTLVYDDDKSATFVKKEKLGDYEKKVKTMCDEIGLDGSFVRVNKASVVYKELDPKSEIIRYVKEGEFLEILSSGESWYKVKIDGRVGFLGGGNAVRCFSD